MTTSRIDEKGLVNGAAPEERRRSPRVKIAPNEIVYMYFQSGNGGVVLDVSSAGLSFQTADAVKGAESLSFRLSPPTIQQIEISGQVVWLDETRKRGGLRLSHLPVEVRSEIQLWRRQYLSFAPNVERPAEAKANPVLQNASSAKSRATSETAPAARDGSDPSLPAVQRAPKSPAQVQENPLAARTPFASALGPGLDANAPKSNPWDPPAASPARMYSSEWKYAALSSPEEWRGRGHAVTVSLTVVLFLVIVAVGFFYFGNRRWAGELLIRLGESISGEQSRTSVQTPAEAAVSAGAEAPTTTTVLPTTPSGVPDSSGSAAQSPEASGEQPPASAAEQSDSGVDEPHTLAGASGTDADTTAPGSKARPSPAQAEAKNIPESTRPSGETPVGGDNGEMELARAHRYLQGTGGQDSAVATQLLWVAVGKGNSQAELELADLYLRGEGAVSKNCEQARILLMAAQNNNNPEAGERLAHLGDYGCR
jgi:PilZ domain